MNAVCLIYSITPCQAPIDTAPKARTASTACSPVALYCGVHTSGGYLGERQGAVSRQTGKPSRSERHDGILLGLRDARH
jgi:hypothetical protein